MARKGQVSVQDNIDTNEEFDAYLGENYDKIICMEVFSSFCGQCTAMLSAIRKVKLEIAGDMMVMAKAQADDIDALARFRGKSEPTYLFISKGKTTKIFFGANGIKFCDLAVIEMELDKAERESGAKPRPRVDIQERLSEELEQIELEEQRANDRQEAHARHALAIQAARKKRVCERLAGNVRRLNFIMFWPHCHQAHYDLYEKWDRINLQVAGKELVVLSEEQAREVLYMSDIDANEACMHSLLSGEVMAVLFKMYDTDDRDIIRLMRHALYEEIPEPKDDVPPEDQPPQVTAFMRYATVSKTKPEIRRMRYEAIQQAKRDEEEERERLRLEQARLAREEEEERARLVRQREDEERIARLQAGVKEESPPEETEEASEGEQVEGELADGESPDGAAVEEELQEDDERAKEPSVAAEEEVEFSSQISIEGEEHIPPGGLFVPGLYSPPNELAKANGLAVFFPKAVSQVAQIESEFLPPHVLMTFPIERRAEVMEVASQFTTEIINQGIFAGDDPYTAEHVAYTVKQYDRMQFRVPQPKERLALMVSRRRSLAVLALVSFNPVHISMDREAGVDECQALFPVGYGDDHRDEESLPDEHPKEAEETPPEVESGVVAGPEPAGGEEEVEEEEDEL